MPTLADLVPLVLLPAALVLAVRGLAALGRGRLSTTAADAAVALAIAAAFVVVLFARDVRPSLPLAGSESPWEWVVWLVPAAALVGVVEAAVPAPTAVRVVVRLAAGAAAAWPIVTRLPAVDGADRSLRVAVAAVAVAGLWSLIASSRDPARRRALAVSSVVAVGGGGLVLGLVATTVGMPESLAALSAALGAAAAPVPPRGPVAIPAAAAPTLAVGFVAILLSAFSFLNYGDVVNVPLPTVALLAVAPAAGLAVPRRAGPLVAIALAAAAALVVVAAAAYVGGVFDPGRAPSGY